MSTRSASLVAYAKINLGLRVLYRRPDDYHELRTVFHTVSLADLLEIHWTPGPTTHIEIEGAQHIPDNLVERAGRLLLETLGLTGHIGFVLQKKIPSGAGLGGGSSDAAAVLLALPVLTGHNVPIATLADIATRLGSDIPFFLYGGAALGLGRGEELYPLPDLRPANGILVAPAIHSSTPDAYRDLSKQLTSNALQNKLRCFQQEVWTGDIPADSNDFESVVFARHPALKQLKDQLLSHGAHPAAMSGSGSSLFGFFASAEAAATARLAFMANPTFPISLVSRAQYRAAWLNALESHIQGNEWPPRSRYAQ